jgi:glycosyltransferase involved in cell wall biosynthesis
MKSDPFFVSVITPVYNGEAFLAEAVESIQQQNYHPLEIIIVDDGSTDDTARIAVSFKGNIRYVYQPNSGPPAARNRGLRMARGNVIGFLDADDLWSENKLDLQLAYLAEDSSVEIVLGRTQLMQLTRGVDGKPEFEVSSDPSIALNLGSALFRKSVFDKVGLFDETLYHCDDWDWFMRARELDITMMIHQEVTRLYRRHERNITNQIELGNQYTIKMLKKSLDRRRQKNNGVATSLPKLSAYE